MSGQTSDPSPAIAMGRSRPAAQTLSPELRHDAATRIAWAALPAAVVFAAYQAMMYVLNPALANGFDDPINRLLSLATVLSGAGLFALHRYRVLPAATVLSLGMLFEVLVATALSMIETSVPFQADAPLRGVSAVGPWTVFIGAFVPNRPVVTLVTALLAATTWPLAYLINDARFDLPDEALASLSIWPILNYLMAIVAFLAGRWTYNTACAATAAEELGSYRLVSRVGEGGMGEVWTATHRMLARSAAIKLVRPESIVGTSARQADSFLKRFRREANAIASLQSPHTVYLYDFGVSEDGRLYYVMELLDGISLQTLVTTFGPQPPGRVTAIVSQICRSLDEAHAQGLVHRDLKPSNVMLCQVARTYDFIKVLDFGLAKSVVHDDETQLTVAGTATGTPGYMAPEVLMGEALVDGRADIYGVGCVAYFLLTGTAVFEDINPTNLALKHAQSPPDPPSQRTELPIPPDLEAVVLQCLAKRQTDRPSTARALQDLLASCGVAPWTPDDAARWWDLHLPPTSSLRLPAQPGLTAPRAARKT